jgi:hypothetical protein
MSWRRWMSRLFTVTASEAMTGCSNARRALEPDPLRPSAGGADLCHHLFWRTFTCELVPPLPTEALAFDRSRARPASGQTTFPAEALKVRRRAPSSYRTRSRLTFVEAETGSRMLARQGSHPRRHPLCDERCTRLVRGYGYPLSAIGPPPGRSTDKMSPAALCSQFQFSTSTLRCARISIRAGLPVSREPTKPASVTLPRSPLRRSQSRADHRTWTPRLPWPAPRTRVMMRLGRITDRARDFSRSGDRRLAAGELRFARASSSRAKRWSLSRTPPFIAPGDTKVPRAATRTSSRMQRTTPHLGEIQGAFNR